MRACILTLLLTLPALAQNQPGFPVQWEHWSFRWRILPRQGLVLSHITFGGKPVLKFAAVAEVFVPYHPGQPRPMDQQLHPFGQNLILLEPGADCLPGGQCRAFGIDGKLTSKRAAVMIHEESPSLVHLSTTGRTRQKMLVVYSAYALGDYTYIVQWRFGQDGSIMPRVGLTGKLAHFGGDETNSADVGADRRALAHVHNIFFCLDFDVDGPANTVEEFNYTPTGPNREQGRGSWSPIKKEGGYDLAPASFRSWRVVNYKSKNANNLPRSYELMPGSAGVFRGAKDEKFTHADLWVTRYKPEEVPGLPLLADGLPKYANNEDVENQDVVLWYMLSHHHQPRTEEWPDMPIEWIGFKLMPRDFLNTSPVEARR